VKTRNALLFQDENVADAAAGQMISARRARKACADNDKIVCLHPLSHLLYEVSAKANDDAAQRPRKDARGHEVLGFE
jgi:hypothetical protein